MTVGFAGFVNTWGPSFNASQHKGQAEAIAQGENRILSLGSEAMQAMWTGTLISTVAQVVTGPFYSIAQFFQVVFNPFITVPLTFLASFVKERLYESTISFKASAATQYFTIGTEEAKERIPGTVTLNVEGVDRHFLLGQNLNWWVRRTHPKEDGQRYWIKEMGDSVPFSENTVLIQNGNKISNAILSDEPNIKNHIWLEVNHQRECFELGDEVTKPILGTVTVDNKEYSIIPTNEKEFFRYAKIEAPEQTLHYETGKEIDAPQEGSYTFVIGGEEKHFASAKRVKKEALGFSGWLNSTTKSLTGYSFIPTRLSKTSSNALRLVNEHFSSVIQVATLVSAATLISFGHVAMGAGVISALGYEYLNNDLGVIPHNISLFMERWMPTLSMVGLLIVGTPFAQVTAGITLLLTIPSVQLFLHHKIAAVVRSIFVPIGEPLMDWFASETIRNKKSDFDMELFRNHPTLEDFDAPLIQRKDLNATEMREILETNFVKKDNFWQGYEVNPAALTKNVEPLLKLEEDRNFDILLTLWEEHKGAFSDPTFYQNTLMRLQDDDRFIAFLQKKFPHAERLQFKYDPNQEKTREMAWEEFKESIKDEIEGYVQQLVEKEGQTKEQFILNWVETQFRFFVDKIKTQAKPVGERVDLQHAIDNTSKIIPLIEKGHVPEILRQLAIEGGDYCSLALKRITGEILRGLSSSLREEVEADLSPNERFERKFLESFQVNRDYAIQCAHGIMLKIVRGDPRFERFIQDVHLYEAVSSLLKRNFYPMTEEELGKFSLSQLLLTETALLPMRVILQFLLQDHMDAEMERIGSYQDGMKNHFVDYLREWVQKSDHLQQNEKQELLIGPLSDSLENMADSDMYKKWHLLMLVIHGIVRKSEKKTA